MKVAALVCLAVCVVAASALPKKVEVAVSRKSFLGGLVIE